MLGFNLNNISQLIKNILGIKSNNTEQSIANIQGEGHTIHQSGGDINIQNFSTTVDKSKEYQVLMANRDKHLKIIKNTLMISSSIKTWHKPEKSYRTSKRR